MKWERRSDKEIEYNLNRLGEALHLIAKQWKPGWKIEWDLWNMIFKKKKVYRRYKLEDELFPKRGSSAQVPYVYDLSHNLLLNRIMNEGVREVNTNGEVSYLLEEKEEDKPAPQLYLVTGEARPPGYNWLSGLSVGTCFVTRPYKTKAEAKHPFMDEYHVVFQGERFTKLITNLNSTAIFVVDPTIFCNTMELVEVIFRGEDIEQPSVE